MQFFKDFYKYDDIIEAPEYGSTEYEQENKRVEILGKQYDDYLKGIKKHLPRNFFDVYYKYSQFQDWNLTVLNFDHTVYNHPTVTMLLTHPNYKEQIKLEYINIKSFYVDLQSRYFHDYLSGKPGLVGVNEFMYENDCLTHEIYFCSTESLKITYKKLKITVSK